MLRGVSDIEQPRTNAAEFRGKLEIWHRVWMEVQPSGWAGSYPLGGCYVWHVSGIRGRGRGARGSSRAGLRRSRQNAGKVA